MAKKLLKWLAQTVWLEVNATYDYWRFKRFYAKKTSIKSDRQTLEAWVLQDKHRLEKAFSLPSPRLGFGKEVIARLCENLVLYRDKYGKQEVYYIGLGALKAYRLFHVKHQVAEPDFFTGAVQPFIIDFDHSICERAGFYALEVWSDNGTNSGFKSLCHSRRSCRHYDLERSRNIGEAELAEIMSMAITSPSVCNRQHWRVHFFTGSKVADVLRYQNGNAGFNENIPWLALVTSDVRAFYSPDERNQPYVDGGIFSMNLMYAIQAMGMASCPLNWCNSFFKDWSFRKMRYVPKNEVVVLAIAFGYPFDEAIYAKSPRLSLSEFYKIH